MGDPSVDRYWLMIEAAALGWFCLIQITNGFLLMSCSSWLACAIDDVAGRTTLDVAPNAERAGWLGDAPQPASAMMAREAIMLAFKRLPFITSPPHVGSGTIAPKPIDFRRYRSVGGKRRLSEW
ncbi:hypothetical protein D3C72_1597010 [compost metagenome]